MITQTGVSRRMALAAEAFGNKMCFLEDISAEVCIYQSSIEFKQYRERYLLYYINICFIFRFCLINLCKEIVYSLVSKILYIVYLSDYKSLYCKCQLSNIVILFELYNISSGEFHFSFSYEIIYNKRNFVKL